MFEEIKIELKSVQGLVCVKCFYSWRRGKFNELLTDIVKRGPFDFYFVSTFVGVPIRSNNTLNFVVSRFLIINLNK